MAHGDVALEGAERGFVEDWETRPMSLKTRIWEPLLTAIPADS